MGAVTMGPWAAAQAGAQETPREGCVDPGLRRDTVRFAGYAARFDLVDRGGDVVRPGAFAASLAARPQVPLLWQHDPGQPCGIIERLEEDARGLRVVGALHGAAAEAVRDGAVTGLSFGYRVKAAAGTGPRQLRVLELVEVSLVHRPMQPKARVLATVNPPRLRGGGSRLSD